MQTSVLSARAGSATVAAGKARAPAALAAPHIPTAKPFLCGTASLARAAAPRVASASPVVTAAAASDTPMVMQGKEVPKTSILVVGGTGTLGRQVVRRALDEGYDVRVLVRPRPNPADFLRDWGATVVQGDLTDITSIPAVLVGVHSIIDCSTARPEESVSVVDWEGKKALIQCAQAMGIQKYVFFSIANCEKHPEVPLMNIKAATEEYLAASGVPFTIFRVPGFMQAIIGNYAVPILEEKQVWGTTDATKTAYLDTQDVAKITMASVRSDAVAGKTLNLAGPEGFTTQEVISKCEKLADSTADVSNVPVWLLRGTRGLLKSFQWAADASDRLAFAEVLADASNAKSDMAEVCEALDIDPASITTLDTYLEEYFNSILKKLKEVGASSKQTNFYV